MENIKLCWEEIGHYLTLEQSSEICIYFSYVVYLSNCYDQPILNNQNIQQWKILEQLCSYDGNEVVKKAARDLEKEIHWDELESDFQCGQRLDALRMALQNYVHCLEHLDEVVEFFLMDTMLMNGSTVTPNYMKYLVSRIACMKEYSSILDLNSSIVGLGLDVYDAGKEHKVDGPLQLDSIVEKQKLCASTIIRMFCHGINHPQVSYQHILGMKEKRKYDVVLMDLLQGNNESILSEEVVGLSSQFENVPQYIFREWGYIYKAVEQINDTGRAFLVVTQGALFRKREEVLREFFIKKDWVDAVITLPEGLYKNKNIPIALIILDKRKEKKHRHKILFADLQLEDKKDTQLARLHQMLDAYRQFESVESIVTIEEIQNVLDKNCSWNPFLYVQMNQLKKKYQMQVKLKEVAEIVRGAQITKEEEKNLTSGITTHYWMNIRNIKDDRIVLDKDSKIRAKDNYWINKFELQEDDIVITSKGTEFKICIVPPNVEKVFISGNLTRIRAKQVHSYILYEFLKSKIGRICLESIQTGTTIRVINNTNLENLKIPDFSEKEKMGEQLKQAYCSFLIKEKEIQEVFKKEEDEILNALNIVRKL